MTKTSLALPPVLAYCALSAPLTLSEPARQLGPTEAQLVTMPTAASQPPDCVTVILSVLPAGMLNLYDTSGPS
jgi:hypothetical protein